MTALVLDTEVNSLDAREVVELAYLEADIGKDGIEFGEITVKWFKPSQPFQAGAVAVHGICPEDVASCLASSEATLPPSDYIIAHNVDFDAEVMKIEDRKRICTLALSRRLWPEFRSHALAALYLELFGINPTNARRVKEAHSASTDVELLTDVLVVIFDESHVQSMQELYEFSEISRVPTHMPFGKHKGTPITEIPPDYVSWLMRQDEVDPYLKQALAKRS